MELSREKDSSYEMSKSELSERFVGQTVPSSYGYGPKKPKKCTDLICLFLCLLYGIGIIVGTGVLYPKSKLESVTHPRDSDGNLCGYDEKTKDFPYLYMVKLDSKYESVCVKECPRFDYIQIRTNSSGNNDSKTIPEPIYFEDLETKAKERGLKFDNNSVVRQPLGPNDPAVFQFAPEETHGFITERQFNLYQARQSLNCSATKAVPACRNHNPLQRVFIYDSRPFIFNICYPVYNRVASQGFFKMDNIVGYFSDIKNSWHILLASIGICLLFTVIFMLISSFMLKCFLWLIIVLTILIFLFVGILGIMFAVSPEHSLLEKIARVSAKYDPKFNQRMQKLHDETWLLWTLSIGFILLSFLLIYLICASKKAISLSLSVLQIAAGFLVKKLILVIIAVFCFILQVLTFAGFWFCILIIHTSGEISENPNASPITYFEYKTWTWALVIAAGIYSFWAAIFWNNLSDMTCGARACHYYHQQSKNTVKLLFTSFYYHFGSIAFASLILPPVTVVQILFQWFYDLSTDERPNVIQRCLAKVCCCFVYPYQKFFNRTTETGLTMTYYSNTNFCPSTKRNHYLGRRVGDAVGRASFINLLFKVAIILVIGLSNFFFWSWVFAHTSLLRSAGVNSSFAPMAAIILLTVFVCGLVLSTYSSAAEAFVLCYQVELDLSLKPSMPNLSAVLDRDSSAGFKKLQ